MIESRRIPLLMLLLCAVILTACDVERPTPPPESNISVDTAASLTAIFGVGGTQMAGTLIAESILTGTSAALTPQATSTGPVTPTEPDLEATPSGGTRVNGTATEPYTDPYTTPGPTPTGATATPTVPVIHQPGDTITLDFSELVDHGIAQRPGPSVQAYFLSPPPNIDGNVIDIGSPAYTANNLVFGKGFVSGPTDLSAVFRIGWDRDNLYIGVVVRDSSIVQLATGPGIWQGDSIELLLDIDVAGDYASNQISADDIQLGISPGNLKEGGQPEAYLWAPEDLEGVLAAGTIVAHITADGWVLEAAIPWNSLGHIPFENQHIGFVFSVSDNDNTSMNAQQSVASFAPKRILYDPTQWFDLWLINP